MGPQTGSISEMDELLRKCWLPIFAKHDENHPEPKAGEFMNKYGDRIPGVPQGLPIITVEDLRSSLNRIPSSGAGGLDGCKPGEVKQLPNQILEMLLLLFDLVESSGVWPEPLAWAGITLIPNGEGGVLLESKTDHGYSHRVPLLGVRPNETLQPVERIMDPPKPARSQSQAFDYEYFGQDLLVSRWSVARWGSRV